jgi:PIF1-like helicase
LKMYIGGMAGTGKSQVIKALIRYFEMKEQSFIFLIMAPTGAAAALVSGSTYHSVLGINGYQANESVKTMSVVFKSCIAQPPKNCNWTATGPSGNRTIGCGCPEIGNINCRLPNLAIFLGPIKTGHNRSQP